jgi:hypothetical protein
MAYDSVICFETFKEEWWQTADFAAARIEAVIETVEVAIEFTLPAA